MKGEKHVRTGHIGETDDNWDNGFYTNGLIFGFPVNFLIDSGSTASILSIDVYEKLPSNVWCSLVPNKSEIFDVNGNKVFAIGSIILELMLGQEIFSQNFMICNINQDGILGQDFLLKEVSKVNYQRMVLHTIHNQEIQCWIGGICRVEIKDNMTIPPMTSTMMPVEIPGVNHLTEYGLIEGTTGTAKSTLTIPGIINTQDQVHFVNVVNYGDDEVKLYKKETIGTCESYTEHDLKPEQIRTLQKDCFTASEEIPEHLTDLLKRSSTYINEDQRQQLSRLLSQRFVKGFAAIARPMHKICEKNSRFAWNDECQKAFQQLKSALTSTPVLAYPLPNLPFILDTDASDKAVGAVLSQIQDGLERVIAYMSKSMNIHEQAYCVTRKELLAVIIALKTFHHYLYGQEVLLRTDNAAVSWMKNLKKPTGQTARWLEELGTYNLTVTHRAGRKHSNADALSRRPCKSCERQESGNHTSDDETDEIQLEETDFVNQELHENEEPTPRIEIVRVCTRSQTGNQSSATPSGYCIDGWDPDSIRQCQLEDPDMSLIVTYLQEKKNKPDWDQVSKGTSFQKTIWRQWDRLTINNGMLYRKFYCSDKDDVDNFKLQLLVPKSHQKTVFKYFHDVPSAGHLGPDKMLSRIQQLFYWPAMKSSITRYCKECDQCAARKSLKRNKAPLGQYLVGEPMERVAIDILGPLPLTKRQNRYVLVLCDCFSKWTEAYAIPDQESLTIARTIVNEFICRFGSPLQLHSDQGRSFEAKLFQDLCDLLKIDKTRSTSQHPQSNGSVERFNRTLLSMLTFYCQNDQRNWDEILPQVMMAYRSSVHASTGQTPNMMMFGRNIFLPMEAVIPRPDGPNESTSPETDKYVNELQDAMSKSHVLARKHLKQNSEYQKRHYDLKAVKRELQVGQAVWLYDASKKKGICHKLTSKWKGPYVVTRKIDDITYLVRRSKKQPGKVYHIDRLLPYQGRNPPTWFSSRKTGESHDGIPRVGSTLEEYVRETNGHCFSGHIIGCKGRMNLPARGMAD
ncbi:unnamed protein product [Mytilus edulis]|uniref:Integrase catalytic domain-containing protein n=1 Tax=Mytilus edulis TaxID=6550 RepID=A0A8S3TKM3_MYTED|nr:unnamed protein product [Mytilus edulis]